jgi:hypothetical protein
MSWVELVDPSNSYCFFANLDTGECDWELPPGAVLKDKDSNQEEWWELFDENHKLPYYYNTKTMETVWDPPNCDIIPLAKLQKVMKDREDTGAKRKSTLIFSPDMDKLSSTFGKSDISPVKEEKDEKLQEFKKNVLLHGISENASKNVSLISEPQNNPEAAKKMKDAMMEEHQKEMKKLPNEIITDIKNFSIAGFAEKYFAKHKRGFIFRRIIPIKELLRYQNYTLKKPLMIQSENYKKDGIKCFKNILLVSFYEIISR